MVGGCCVRLLGRAERRWRRCRVAAGRARPTRFGVARWPEGCQCRADSANCSASCGWCGQTTAPPPPPNSSWIPSNRWSPSTSSRLGSMPPNTTAGPPTCCTRCSTTREPARRAAAGATPAAARRHPHRRLHRGPLPRHPITRLRHLLSDRTDVVYADSPILGYAARQNPGVEVSAENDITPVAVGTPKGDGTLPAVAAALEHIVTTPEYRKVLDNYGLDSMAVADARGQRRTIGRTRA